MSRPSWRARVLSIGLVVCCSPSAWAVLGWVGNLFPAGGSTSTVEPGGDFYAYVQVWKGGVTDQPGQGANITCTLHWGEVGVWGQPWSSVTDTPMTYHGDVVNNDEYRVLITPAAGLYELTAFCTDTSDASTTWQDGSIARLVVRPTTGSCATAAQGDNNLYWSALLHDSFSADYRSPVGPLPTTAGSVSLVFRTCLNDLGGPPSVRVWDDRANVEAVTAMVYDGAGSDPVEGGVAFWRLDLTAPADPTILYYVFKATDGTATVYYRDDDPRFYGGGYGAAEANQSTAYSSSYQMTVYDPSFAVPEWMHRGVVYQVYPDRFRDGDPANNPLAGRFFYGALSSIVRSGSPDWNATLCDPRDTYSPGCPGHWSDNFYGGDLEGIRSKIAQGYFDALGVSVLYLNPIFSSPSNHKYDTRDYLSVDPDFGTLEDFRNLVDTAAAHGIEVLLDGVFNHTSSDSVYFDRYHQYATVGACEDQNSPYRSWYTFYDVAPGTGGCVSSTGVANGANYDQWFIYDSLPRLVSSNAGVRDLVWDNGAASVGPYWVAEGAAGWRFDVGGDVDPGVTADPTNTYWEGFRAAVRAVRNDTVTLGEEWGDGSPWLLGNEWDLVMNYRFRSAALGWLFTGCAPGSNGCSGDGTVFQDNDSEVASASGAISRLSPSLFNARLLSIWEDYPEPAWKGMLNLAGSHDTNRVRFLLKKGNLDDDDAAAQRTKELWLFAFTYAGAPTVYYGDEVGLNHDGVFWSGKYEDDPYNRAPFPWDDTPGDYLPDTTDLLPHLRRMASVRLACRALEDGDVVHGAVLDDASRVYGFGRVAAGGSVALVALNRDDASHDVTFSGLGAPPYSLSDGEVLVDVISGTQYQVSGGELAGVTVTSNWGAVLVDPDHVDTPLPAAELYALTVGADVVLSWRPVIGDTAGGREVVTAYDVHRGATPDFTPDGGTLLDTVTPPPFGSADGRLHSTDVGAAAGGFYYLVRAHTAAGAHSDARAVRALFADGFETGTTSAWSQTSP